MQRLVVSVNHTKIHKPKKCAKCGSKDITDTKISTKMTIDIPYIPKTEYTNNIIHHCTCKCGYTTGRNRRNTMVMLHTTVSKQFNGARSHILRDAEFESVDESKTMLYEKLCLLYHNAKQISWSSVAHVHYDSSVISGMVIADVYKNLNCKFGD